MWKKILLLSILLVIALIVFLRLCYFTISNDDVYAYIRTGEFSCIVLLAILLSRPVYYLYKRTFKKKIEKNPASFYSRSWFVKLVCGFVVISIDFTLAYLFHGFKCHTFMEMALIIFALSCGLFAMYTIIIELIESLLVTLEAIEKNG